MDLLGFLGLIRGFRGAAGLGLPKASERGRTGTLLVSSKGFHRSIGITRPRSESARCCKSSDSFENSLSHDEMVYPDDIRQLAPDCAAFLDSFPSPSLTRADP